MEDNWTMMIEEEMRGAEPPPEEPLNFTRISAKLK